MRSLAIGSNGSLFIHQSRCSTDTAELINTRSLTDGIALFIKVSIRNRYIFSGPHLHSQSLQSRINAVMNIFCRDAIAYMIVPYGKHTAEDRRIFLRENSLSNLYRSPIFVQILRVQIIIIVSGSRNNVYQPVRNTNQFIALLYHVFRVGIAIVPSTHDHILRFHRCITFGMRQCSPYTSLFAKALYIADIMVGESTELLYYIFFLI